MRAFLASTLRGRWGQEPPRYLNRPFCIVFGRLIYGLEYNLVLSRPILCYTGSMGDYTQVPNPPADPVPAASPSADLQPVTPISPQPASSLGGSSQVPQQSDVQTPADSPVPTEPQSPPVSIAVEAPKEVSVQDHPPSNQPSQVQPEAPQNTPVTQGENNPPQSAGIKPEPPEAIQNTPSADSKPPESPKASFGDLSETVQPVLSASPPVVISPPQSSSQPASQPQPIPSPVEIPSPVSSFGNLMEKPADLSEEPAIHIDPIEAPPIAPVTPPVTPPMQPKEENQAALAVRRQHATEARKQKREENLTQVIELVQKKGKVDNLDVRDFLHISQTTATDYLRSLVSSGKLKKEGKAKATKYFL